MSFTYYLDLGAGTPPEHLKSWVATAFELGARAPALSITTSAVDPDEAECSLSQYGFRPIWRIALRQPSSSGHEDVDHHMFLAIQALLAEVPSDAAMETQDPITVLVRKNGEVVLNRQCDAARWAARFFPQARWADLPAL